MDIIITIMDINMEKFVWLDSSSFFLGKSPTLIKGNGFCTMKPTSESYATVSEIRSGKKLGFLMSATAITTLKNNNEKKYVILKRSSDASIEPNMWQFPAGRCDENELPFQTALRELAEEIKISTEEHSSWNKSYLKLNGEEIAFFDDEHIDFFRGKFIFNENTLEFFYEVILEVNNFDNINLTDNEQWQREVKLINQEELMSMLSNQELTTSSALIVKNHFNIF